MLDFFGDIGSAIMTPLYYAISFVLVGFHNVLGDIFGPTSGLAWVLSIIGLTLVVRAALIPLFVKQIKSSRNMQLIQPKVRELQKKYGHDREKLAQETMALYKDSGTNPFASCLPILLQMPIFLALFRILDQAARNPETKRGLMTPELNEQLRSARVRRRQDLRHVPQRRRHRGAGAGGGAGARDDRDHLPHAAPADEQEHAG